MTDETIQLLLDKQATDRHDLLAAGACQAKPEIARKFGIPEWKMAERKKAVADTSRFDGAGAGREGRRADRLRHRRGQPGRATHDAIAPS